MSDKFLNPSGSGNTDLTNGSTNAYLSSLTLSNLRVSMPIKTNSVSTLVSSKLDITDINTLESELNSLKAGKVNVCIYTKNICSFNDLPTPIGGVIYLLPNVVYFITTHIDIGLNRLECGNNIVGIFGYSSEVSSISSDYTGALITSTNSVLLRWITLTSTAGSVLNMDASTSGNPNSALDWIGVNFLNSANIGFIKDYTNFIGLSMAILNSSNLTFNGTIGTIAFNDCIFTTPTGASIIISPTCIITRRFRINSSSFVILGVNNAINFSTSAVIPNEQYRLYQVNFSGGATNYLLGVQSSDLKSSHLNNFGIENSRTLANYYMVGNAIPTPIAVVGTYYKILGTTFAEPLTQRFDETLSNKATYQGVNRVVFKVSTTLSITGSNNIDYGSRIGKNGTTIISTQSYFTSTGLGDASNISTQSIIELTTNDYIEVFITNLTNTNSPTVVDMNVIILKIDT